MSRKKILGSITGLVLGAASLVVVTSAPAEATLTPAQRKYCNHHNQFKASKTSESHNVPGKLIVARGTTTHIYTYSFCRIPGVQRTWVRGRNLGVCFKIGRGGTRLIDSVKTDMLAWNNNTVMNKVDDFILHLPESMSGGESHCDTKEFEAADWYPRNSLPRHRENFWFGIEPPWPDQHHETPIIFLDPKRDNTVRVTRTVTYAVERTS